MRCVFRSVFVACALVLLAACSTTDFAQPIKDFSTAAKKAQTDFTGYAGTLEKLKGEQNVNDVADDPDLLKVDGCKLRVKPARCVLLVRGEALKPQYLVHTGQIMTAIVTYSDDLTAIASADDIGQLKTASDAIPGAVNGLASAVDAFSAQQHRPTNLSAQVAAISTPAGEILTIALTKIAEYEKLKALREATARMDAIFPDAMLLMANVAITNQNISNRTLFRNYEAARAAYSAAAGPVKNKLKERPKPGAPQQQQDAYNKELADLQSTLRNALNSYNTAAQGLDAGLKNPSQAAFTALADSHAALVRALEMPEPDFKTVFVKLQEFAQITATVAADVKKIDDALNPKTKT